MLEEILEGLEKIVIRPALIYSAINVYAYLSLARDMDIIHPNFSVKRKLETAAERFRVIFRTKEYQMLPAAYVFLYYGLNALKVS